MTLTFAGKQTLRSERYFNISFPDNATNTINKLHHIHICRGSITIIHIMLLA